MNTQYLDPFASLPVDEETSPHVAASIEALPALMIQVEGKVVSTNLDQFKQAAQTFIANIKTELVNDQDFADADKMVKFLKDGEERLALCKDQAQSQAKSIDELFRTIDAISEQMRSKRLALDKLVKAEKENRRTAILIEADNALSAHFNKLNERIGGRWMPVELVSAARFAEAIKGLKSLDSMRDKVSTALANAKVEADMLAERIEINKRTLDAQDDIYMSLFPDLRTIITKPNGDFMDTVNARIAAYKAAEAEKAEAARKAEDERVAAAVEAERVRAAAEAAKPAANDQGGKAEPVGGAVPAIASTPPIQQSDMGQSLDGLAGRSARLTSAPRGEAVPIPDATMIDDFIRLLSIAPVAKKALRADIVAWETYRIKTMAARGLAVAA